LKLFKIVTTLKTATQWCKAYLSPWKQCQACWITVY